MDVLENTMINDIISASLQKSISYQDYRALVEQLTAENTTTGPEKTEVLANYTALNDRRMHRWDKTVKVSDEAKFKIENSLKKMTWLVLTESWCGDAAHIMPVINKLAELNKNIDYKVVLRDENEALMNEFLTNGAKAIPKLIMINNETGEVENTFGPRPSVATNMVNDYKEKHGKLTPEFKEDLQRWYNKDKGQTVIADLVELI
ncbi:thioredoxin family protein [Winogradskyella litorisediminis]|uniref:Thioredoxin family protein n=1 Tax=Winogradskyella litorisediminis TaxID=1156618 RepID=A0ABW3N9I7_9FLAO